MNKNDVNRSKMIANCCGLTCQRKSWPEGGLAFVGLSERGLLERGLPERGLSERGMAWERVGQREGWPEGGLTRGRFDQREGWPEGGLVWERVAWERVAWERVGLREGWLERGLTWGQSAILNCQSAILNSSLSMNNCPYVKVLLELVQTCQQSWIANQRSWIIKVVIL